MKCPRCGWEQPNQPVCVACGKVLGDDRRAVGQKPDPVANPSQHTAEHAGQPPHPGEDRRPPVRANPQARVAVENRSGGRSLWDRPVKTYLRMFRAFAGLCAVVLGGWTVMFQENLVLPPVQLLLVLAYGFVGLFWVLTVFIPISMKQFAIEMLAFLATTIAFRMAIPEAFDPEGVAKKVISQAAGGGAGAKKAGQPSDDATAVNVPSAGYLKAVRASCELALQIASERVGTEGLELFRTQAQRAHDEWASLDEPGREPFAALQEKFQELVGQVNGLDTPPTDQQKVNLKAAVDSIRSNPLYGDPGSTP